MQFDQVIMRAWQIIWKHKVLWIFGILAGCGGQVTSNGYRGSSNWGTGPGDIQNIPRWFEQWADRITEQFTVNTGMAFAVVGMIVLLSIVMALVFMVLGVIGQISLVRSTVLIESGVEQLTAGEIWQEALPYFWRVLGLFLAIGLAYAAIAVVMVGFVFVGTLLTLGLLTLCLIPLLCLLVPLSFVINIIIKQSVIALVVEDLDLGQALGRGWEVVRTNLSNVVIMAIFLVIGAGFVNFVVGLPMVFAIFPALAAATAGGATGSQEMLFGSIGVMALCLVLYLPIYLILAGAIRAYTDTAWTLTYLELAGPGMPDLTSAPPPELEPESVIGDA